MRLTILATLLCCCLSAKAIADRPMNVLLITADDLGLQLSCYGETIIQTPHLDKLADDGVRFQTAYVAQASCSPSRSAMFTGLFPHTNGQLGLANTDFGYPMHEQFHNATIPNLLKANGYRTGIIGKLHVKPEDSFQFDFRPRRVNTRKVKEVAAQAGQFMGNGSDKPFFMMVNYSDPHIMKTHWDPQIDGVPAEPVAVSDETYWPFQGVTNLEQRKRIANYYSTAKRIDDAVGMLLAQLDDHGLTESTLVIFLGDHGPPFMRGKTTCYEAGLRVPFIVRWPGVSGNFSSEAFVSAVDILPTILDATGTDSPDVLHGRSLRPVVTNQDSEWRKYLAAEFHTHGRSTFFPRRAIRNDRFKLIHNLRGNSQTESPLNIDSDPAGRMIQQPQYDNTAARRAFDTSWRPPEFELYDLQSDPIEFHNLADDARYASHLSRLQTALLDWRQQTEDPFLKSGHIEEWEQHITKTLSSR